MGVKSFHIILHLSENMNHLIDEKLSIFRKQGITPEYIYTGPWNGEIMTSLTNETIKKYSDDWFIIADQDEFQVYPNEINNIIDLINSDVNFLSGCLLDRISKDGKLTPVNYKKSIWQQYPMCGFMAFPIARANPYKITLCKGHITLSEGKHGVLVPKEDYPITNDIICQVHHFKWTGSFVNRILGRFEQESNGDWVNSYPLYGNELRRSMDYFQKHNNKFDIDNQLFKVEYSPTSDYKSYSKWNEITTMLESWEKLHNLFSNVKS